MENILVVDDEKSMRDFLRIMLEKEGYDVSTAENGEEALHLIRNESFDLVLTDIKMPKSGGMDLLGAIKEFSPQTPVVLITAYGTTESAVEAMKRGAYDYITKPFNVDEIKLVIQKGLERKRLAEENIFLKGELREKYVFSNIIGRSPEMLRVFDLIRKVADARTSVLITGKSGTGKELVAKAIHYNSRRRNGPFVSISCGAMPETLLESELFGYQKGAFTGADANKAGLLEMADGGTFFLDEIGDAPLSVQVKLLRVLQEMEFKRVGGTKDIHVDVRILAATNRDLLECVKNGTFREDLYYRLNVIIINLAPLSERKEDIPHLVEHFIKKYCLSEGKEIKGISKKAMAALEGYHWPGNVRELENVIERMVVLEAGQVIIEESLPENIRDARLGSGSGQAIIEEADLRGENKIDLEKLLKSTEKNLILKAMDSAGGSIKKAGELLGLSFRSMRYKLHKHGFKKKTNPDPDELEPKG
ncbi:MAG: sigma-54-dependent Fis family transcriptional regulator [Nitrospinae bacterium]|nr:sigma-54-dependent Fis family transcriptional regulator [Nitrospinota bacterium]